MFKIKTLNKISPYGLDNFDQKYYTYGDDIENPDAVMVRSASMHEYEMPASLKAIARAGAGVNNIPVDKCSEAGIVVFNTPGANANAVKEMVVTGLLISSRKVIPAIDWARTLKGNGAEVGKLVEKGKGAFTGPEIHGKTLGVVGLGAIGILVANAAKALGMEVYGYDPYLSVEAAWNLSSSINHAKSLKEIYNNCDYITIHVPLNSETRGMINDESIGSMKQGVRILNFSRAELVVDGDIIKALETGKVSVYVTDFPTDEVLCTEGVIAIPHLGASTPESEDNCAVMAARELINFLETGNIINSVNLPDVDMPKTTDSRICVIHKNIPNMLTQISGLVAQNNINIENMINKSKKDYAYTVLDVTTEVSCELTEKITGIEGVIRVWVIK
ncbi:MAG: 3-phosphoglycerate dehydrogenase [Clostridiales bacterium 43-6]|nr:MAG: 3-phosphoglycerate dehydrogenase [Clostridiales bacterium 43-6]